MNKTDKEKNKRRQAAEEAASAEVPTEKEEVESTQPEDNAADEKTAALEKEIAELKEKNADLNDQLLRRAAEFDNFRKRTQKEKLEMTSFTKALCMKEILGVLDNFERALETESKDADFKKGVDMIFHQMTDAIQKLGVQEIEAMNQKFDPEVHNAIKQMEDEAFGENTICQVLQKGYRLEDRVIRHAMVVVANP